MTNSSYLRYNVALVLILLNAVGFFCLTIFADEKDKIVLAFISVANIIALIILKRKARTLLPLMFAATFVLFHLSLLLIDIVNVNSISEDRYLSRWYFASYTMKAYTIATLFLASFALAVLMVPEGRSPPKLLNQPQDPVRSNALLWIFAGLAIFFLTAVFFALEIENYSDYNQIARREGGGLIQAMLIFLYPALAVSAFLCVVRVRSLKLFSIIFGCWALPTFAVGLRGEVLVPVAMMVPSLSKRFQLKVRVVPALLISWALLWLISFVGIYRAENDYVAARAGASPIAGLMELGGSIRPVYEVVRWTDTGARDFYHGATYWAPLERLVLKVFPVAERLPAHLDERLMNVAIVKMTGGGNYGFSIAAEAYVNFGWAGVMAIAGLAGVALTLAGKQFEDDRVGVVNIALVYALLFHVRQSYVGAWGGFFIVALLAYLMIWVDRRFSERAAKWAGHGAAIERTVQ